MAAINNDQASYYCAESRRLLAAGDKEVALASARKAYKFNKYRRETWKVLAESLLANGCEEEAIFYGVLLANNGDQSIAHAYTPATFTASQRAREYSHLGMINVSHCPLLADCLDEKGRPVGVYEKSCIGDFLPGELFSPAVYRYYVGVYNSEDFKDFTAGKIRRLDRFDEENYNKYHYDNIPFDIMRGKKVEKIEADYGQKTVILPLAGTATRQIAHLSDGQRQMKVLLGQYEFSLLRCQGRMEVSSRQDMVAGEPILLEHQPHRHKLVLNILLDGLSWSAMAQWDFHHIPNLCRFFAKGLIFEEAFSPSEYTFTSLNSMAAGRYMHHLGVIDEAIYAPIDHDIKTISEQMKAQGYYCVNIAGDGRCVMPETMRGFDRLIIYPYLKNSACVGVRRTIDHLEAFSECDNYVFLHISDPHPYGTTVAPAMPVQTKNPWYDIAFDIELDKPALRLESSTLYRKDNLYMIERMDAELGLLFDYLEKHYQDDEYVVNVFSDHGVSIYTDEEYFFKDTQCHVAMMCRGAGIPQGTRSKELVNGIDLYAIMSKECGFGADIATTDANLPAAMGGKERAIIYSQSIFPGQTYKLCMRTKVYECRLETKAVVSPDCVVDIDDFELAIYTRDEEHRPVKEQTVRDYFLEQAADFLLGLVETV